MPNRARVLGAPSLVPVVLADALRERALVVVQAPAGYGKTTAVRDALAGEADLAWYDAQPWEAEGFAAALIACVRAIRPDVGRLTLALASDGIDPSRLGATFADELRHVDAPLRIVVDDAHALGPGFAAFVRTLVARMPASVQVALLTRSALDVGLAEAVAAGRGAAIDATALRFDVERTRALATRLQVVLDDVRLDALVRRTDGWPIAVALALRAPDAPALLDELVLHRVDALDAADRALLEATLVYEIVEPAVIAPDDPTVPQRLAALAADAVLVAPVGAGFRVHPLVRDLLLRRLGPADIARREADAARAYVAAGRFEPALFHLDRACDPAEDRAFLRAHAAAALAAGLDDGVRAALARVRATNEPVPEVVALVEGLFAKARGEDGRPAFERAVTEADARGDEVVAFEARLQGIEADLAHGTPVAAARLEDLLQRADARGTAARAHALVRAGWAEAIGGRFAAALARLDAVIADDPAVRAAVAPLAAYAHLALGAFEASDRAADAAIDAFAAGDNLPRYASALTWAARFALLRGETTAAYELAREAERIARPFARRADAPALHGTLAEAALHHGDTAVARRAARTALRTADAAWYARDAQRVRALATRSLARADALDAAPETALAAALAIGDDPVARADAALFAVLAGSPDARALRTDARAALGAAVPVDGADAVALWSAGELVDLLEALEGGTSVTELAASPFDALLARRAEAPSLAELGALLRGIGRDGERVAAYEARVATLTQAGPRFEIHVLARLAESQLRRAVPETVEALLEPLTPREHEILALLAAGLTNREIAQRFVVSSRTVETHVAHLTAKLGVSSRARAVARAVALGVVLPPAETSLGGS